MLTLIQQMEGMLFPKSLAQAANFSVSLFALCGIIPFHVPDVVDLGVRRCPSFQLASAVIRTIDDIDPGKFPVSGA